MSTPAEVKVNLLPADRVEQRRRVRALSRWGFACVLCAFVCAVPVVAVAISPVKGRDLLLERAAENAGRVAMTSKANEELTQRRIQLGLQSEAVSMLERRIDWRGIFYALAVASTETVRFDQIACGSEIDNDADRVEIMLVGYARSQTGARTFVVDLEQLGLFDTVSMSETTRVTIDENELVRFRVSLVLDPKQTNAGGGS